MNRFPARLLQALKCEHEQMKQLERSLEMHSIRLSHTLSGGKASCSVGALCTAPGVHNCYGQYPSYGHLEHPLLYISCLPLVQEVGSRTTVHWLLLIQWKFCKRSSKPQYYRTYFLVLLLKAPNTMLSCQIHSVVSLGPVHYNVLFCGGIRCIVLDWMITAKQLKLALSLLS